MRAPRQMPPVRTEIIEGISSAVGHSLSSPKKESVPVIGVATIPSGDQNPGTRLMVVYHADRRDRPMSNVRVGIYLHPPGHHLARISIAQNEWLRWHQPRKGSEGYTSHG